ncbi:hypothetical protein DNTS_003313 [Danionella cerebrum]|uniref:Complement component 1 Q subcomponent-binding protein, mitochondrial n=1 Tax=Danionella cerebrum TaxID=2873325 RepID=A0A553MVT2_9TELE|nr:hypothetical protein DNTS_003313 [Danionella translucida]
MLKSVCRAMQLVTRCSSLPVSRAALPANRAFSRSVWSLSSPGSGSEFRPRLLTAARNLPSLSCGCGSLHTDGDKAFGEFLSDEIQQEKKIQKNKVLPKMPKGWELELNGSQAKLTRSISGETVMVTFNINNSIPPQNEEEAQPDEEEESAIVSMPNFVVEVIKEGAQSALVFDCNFPEDEVSHGQEDGEEDADIFSIREVSFQPEGDADWKETSYTLNTDSLDWALYDHLMDFLADRGVDNTFADKLMALSTALEHQEYIRFLEDLGTFVRCK